MLAGQTRPYTQLEFDKLRHALIADGQSDKAKKLGLPVLTKADKISIKHGKKIFQKIGCVSCHKPKMILKALFFKNPATILISMLMH